ncbi:gluconate 2-dehydrogenase subunit 3 family protein [Shewanella psychropiezotolerans]|uniref:Gluconate 2-dehydrogenase subunit 3 family protein n=1 Tax=Shewanella psychropiezotolerans TaxID=2593655 RepID=A0ABX5WUR7_9GAMM|nr:MULTISPECIES: gluconate 2-dehydrogenase subunit 3 family protein [Shewanella]MPY23225.1 gluconate 2-dehydrogenase subunit 3 family protein [Shewanella sp. YLB-07]QDO82845.1 gluconate 2-dehydrogenase subunit 3 family protein [Shewanella psychropiezotolerans]
MLKKDTPLTEAQLKDKPLKAGSSKPELVSVFSSGLNRRAFLRQTGAAAVLLGLIGAKPSVVAAADEVDSQERGSDAGFSSHAQAVVAAVQMQLFPDDDDGPSAKDLNAFRYLTWALDDPDNLADGDRAFILRGVGWLEELAKSTHGASFIKLGVNEQDVVLKQIAKSRTGENWLSLLLYYLLESLTLDPIYGGNTDGIGWQWLEHQPGFPRPIQGKTYLDFS